MNSTVEDDEERNTKGKNFSFYHLLDADKELKPENALLKTTHKVYMSIREKTIKRRQRTKRFIQCEDRTKPQQ